MAKSQCDDASEPLKYQTWVLKVLIHCEGCKKKVKKILQNIDGVYTTVIDSQQQKVTVTGNVDAETLIKKLLKKGKQAEMWPQNLGNPGEASSKSKNKLKQNGPKIVEKFSDDDKNLADNTDHSAKDSGEGNNIQNGQAEKKPENTAGIEQLLDEEIKGGDSEDVFTIGGNVGDGGSGVGGGNGGKKKKKKGKKGNATGSGGEKGGDVVATTSSPMTTGDLNPPPGLMNLSPPLQEPYHYPPSFFPPQIYGLSYNASYPSASSSYYDTSYYAYSDPLPSTYPPPPPSDPITTFDDDHDYDDDDEGECSIM